MSAIPVFKMSLNARCLAEGYAERFKKLHRHKFVLEHDAFHPENTTRDFVKVRVQDQELWADYLTGSLFDPKTGRCLSGISRIKV
mgnify:CR=1 FL=1